MQGPPMQVYNLVQTYEYHIGSAGLSGVRVELYQSDEEPPQFGYRVFCVYDNPRMTPLTPSEHGFGLGSIEEAQELAASRAQNPQSGRG